MLKIMGATSLGAFVVVMGSGMLPRSVGERHLGCRAGDSMLSVRVPSKGMQGDVVECENK